MNISRIVLDLLVKNNVVSIPNLGKFTYSYAAAELFKFTNRVAPPVYKLDFSVQADYTDQSLLNTYIEEYDTTPETAQSIINQWVEDVKSTINKGSQFEINGLGFLKLEQNNIAFTADKNSILFADSFGLESTKIPLMEIEDKTSKKAEPLRASQNVPFFRPLFKKVVAIVAVMLLLGAVAYILHESGAINSAYKSIAKLFHSKKTEKLIASDSDTNAINEAKRNALIYREDSIKASNEANEKKEIVYYIIAGSYKSVQNANKQEKILGDRGFKTNILNLGDTLFRVSIGTYTNRRKAVEEYIALTNQDAELKIWLFSQLE